MARRLISLVVAALAACSWGDSPRVRYTMAFDQEAGVAKVEMRLLEGKTATKFWMSAWIPGDYQVWDFGKTVTEISFAHQGKEVKLASRDGANGFAAAGEWDSVSYTVRQSKGNFSDNVLVSSNLVFVNPAGVLGFADGKLAEAVELSVTGPAGWDFQGSLPDKLDGSAHVMQAKDHETLGDSPFLFAPEVKRSVFTVAGRKHTFAAVGNTAGVDVDAFGAVAKKAVEQTHLVIGDLPYKEYTFFGLWASFPAGLEHGSSCRIGMWGRDPNQAAGIIFHEFFHSVNVKAIRPAELRPIDPLRAPRIKTLWWLEGVTDYFADLLQYRAGITNREGFLDEMNRTYRAVSRNAAYSQISAQESSLKVWDTTGSQGFGGVSYYTKGKLIGFLMDVAIRSETGGKKTLDDMIRRIYQDCRDGQGYDEKAFWLYYSIAMESRFEVVPPSFGDWVESAKPVDWQRTLGAAGLMEQNGRLIPMDNPDEKAKLVFDSFFGKN